jgi:hypothetical protein
MLSLKEIKQKIQAITEAIEKRERQISFIEQSNDVEQIVKVPIIRNEVEILQAEKQRLTEQAETLRKLLETKLPELEKAYLDAVKEERTALRKLYDTCKNLLTQIRELRKIANDTHMKFIPYKNHCDELGIVAKSMHLLELPFTSQIERWLGNFIQWYEKVQAK